MYTITYEFKDPQYNKTLSGIWICYCLEEVGAFYNMVKRYNGKCNCTI